MELEQRSEINSEQMDVNKNLHLNDFFYSIGLFFIITAYFLKSTLIPELNTSLVFSGKALIPLGICFAFASFIISKKQIVNVLLMLIIMPITIFTVYFTWAQPDLMVFMFMFICGYSINREYVLSVTLFIIGFEILLVILLAKTNVLPDLTYIRPNGAYRHSLGFIYPTDFAAHVSYLCFLHGWKRANRFNWIDLAFWLVISYYLLSVTDARLDVLCIASSATVFFFFAHNNRWRNSWYICSANWFVTLVFPIMLFLSFWAVKLYDSSANIAIMANNMLSGRLSLGSRALALYPISFSGNDVFENGLGSITGYNTDRAIYGYFMIDSSYLRISIIYGLISLFLVGFIIAMSTKKAIKERNIFMAIALSMVAVHCFVAQFVINPSYDLILMLALTCSRSDYSAINDQISGHTRISQECTGKTKESQSLFRVFAE